jgi:thiol:disulfide interchange protein DsbD
MKILAWLWLVLAVAVLTAAPARAQVINGVELVHADLLADTSAVAPGKPFTVGLRLKMQPHWHTYWQYSGDAGLPTKIDWQLPPGFTAGPIQWPVPEKISSPGDIENYGYSDEVLLLTQITPPAQLPAGDVTFNAKADWLVCAQICVPGSGQLTLRLPSGGVPAPANAALFAQWRAQLPKAATQLTLSRALEGHDLVWHAGGLDPKLAPSTQFFPLPPDAVQVGHPTVSADAKGLVVRLPIVAGESSASSVGGVLAVGTQGWSIPGGDLAPVAASAPAKAATSDGSLGYFLLLAFLGGLVLNAMPCVLPVISLKLFSFVRQANEEPGRIFRMGLAYAAGVFAWFLSFAILVVILRGAGRQLGYAFQFQNAWFLVAISAVTFVFSLNLLGVFEFILPGALSNVAGQAATQREGYAGAFFQGVLATVLGSACTTSVFGAALGFAFSQSGPVIIAMFAAISAGMSAPFVLLSARPGWLRFVPKPGEWMERVKQATGFLMLGTVLWLLSNLGDKLGSDGVIWAGALLLTLGVACWIYGAFNTFTASARARWISLACIVLLVLGGGQFCVRQIASSHLPVSAAPQAPFVARLDAALKTGRTVFVDFTASWCVNCKVNERLVLDTAPIQQALGSRNAIFLTADWSNGDEDITRLLHQFKRAAVPLYVIYPAGKPDAPIVLPELLTQGIVLDALAAADKASSPIALR